MELTKDFLLRGPVWIDTINSLSPLFATRTNYEIFMLSLAIGIMFDKTIESMEDDPEREPKNVPRNVIQNNDNGKIDLMLKAAILTSKNLNLTEDERLELAFGDKNATDSFDRHGFLLGFANYGVTELTKCVGVTDLESMEKIKNFLLSTLEGRNLDIEMPEEELADIIDEEQLY